MTTCPSCGRESDEGFRFCPHCGSPLAQAPAPRAERKVVTVLFCDLVGFTARSDRADPEDVRAMLQPFHALARREIERHGGTLDKFIGDAAMGVFGSPVSHEDDPERAVRTALAILEGVARSNAEGSAPRLEVRIGVNTGQAIVTLAHGVQEGETVAGDVVNTASRLQAAAAVGTVLVGEPTYLSTHEAFDYQSLEPVTAKGKAEPLPVWRPKGIRAALGAAAERGPSTSFVGRHLELASLEHALRMAVEGPSVWFVTLLGEPGVGKTRLIQEFRSRREGLDPSGPVQWRRGRCLPYGEGIAFWALGEIVKEHAGILDSDPGDRRESKLALALEPLVSDPSERAWLRARLAPLLGVESPVGVERDESFAAWRRYLEATAAAAPLVVVIEDVHWADPALVGFLDHVATTTGPVPMLVIAAGRPELYDRHPSWGAGMRNAASISLRSLSETESAALVSGLLDGAAVSAETRALIVERAGGNPLYAEEVVRMLEDRGALADPVRLSAQLSEHAFPETVQAVIAARLDTLSAEPKAVLHDASVIGKDFWSGAVAFLGGTDEGGVRHALERLATKELVQPAFVSTLEGQLEYSFSHGLVRDVAYAQIPRADRAAKHRAAAIWIERVAGDRTGDLAEILAHHTLRALDLAMAAGETEGIEELRSAARRHLQMAAARAMALDVAEAERHLQRALELVPPGDPERSRILAALGEAAFQSSRMDQAELLYVDAIDGLRSDAKPEEAADAMIRLSVVLEYRGDPDRGRTLLGQAIAILEDLPAGPELARALTESAGTFLVAGRYADVVRESDRAIELAHATGEADAEVRAHGFRGYARVVLGDLEGVQEQREAIRDGLALGLGRAVAVAFSNFGDCLSMAEGSRSALETFRQGLAFAEARGLREAASFLRNSMLVPLMNLGEWDEVLRMSSEVVQEARRAGAGYDEVWAEVEEVRIKAYRQGGAAREAAGALLARARAIGDRPMIIGPMVSTAIAKIASGDVAGAADLVREALDMSSGDSLTIRAEILPDVVRVAVEIHDLDLAGRLIEGMDRLPLPRHRYALVTARATLAEARGDADVALELFEEAAARWAEFGHELERGHALAGVGRCLLALGRQDAAEPSLRTAREIFSRLGAAPLVAGVDARLAVIGSDRP